MVPFCAKALLEQPVPSQHHYRFWGNAICSPAWDEHFGVTTIGWWGMTETVAHGIVGVAHQANASMAMGRPSVGYDIHVLDDNGQAVPSGEVGNLAVRGQRGVSLFSEYFGNPEATAASFDKNGLFLTGDRVRVGDDGFLYFADRAKDMLKVGGENVAASEVERVIMAVEGVSEVAVVAMAHPMLDEVPVAFVIAKADAPVDLVDQIRLHCVSSLAQFKRPHLIRIIDVFPYSTLEKVAKNELRALLVEEMSKQASS